MTTLIFPATTETALAYKSAATRRGETTVAAGITRDGARKARFREWVDLPAIYDDDFANQFTALLKAHDVQRLFCPVSVVYVFLLDFLQRHDLALDWVNDMPLAAEADHYVMMEQEAAPYMPLIAAVADRATPVSQDFFTALLQGLIAFTGKRGAIKSPPSRVFLPRPRAAMWLRLGSWPDAQPTLWRCWARIMRCRPWW